VKDIQVVSSEGRRGPAYIRFSNETVTRTEPWERNKELVVDYDAAGAVVGIELVTLGLDVLDTLVEIARANDLDLSALVAHSFDVSPAA
jgi:uncharacterized protein YuzE